MELRISERQIVALNFLLVAAAAYFAARAVNDLVAARLAPPPVAHVSAALPGRPLAAPHPRSYYQAIVERDMFNLVPQAAGPAPTTVENLRLKLLGISKLTNGKHYVIVEDRWGQQALYRVGDAIPGAGRLLAVEKNRAIVAHQGRRIALELPKNELPGPIMAPPGLAMAAAPKGGPTPPDSGGDDFDPNISELGGNRYAIPRATVEHSLDHLSELFTQVRAVPNIQNGRTNGFALSEIEPGSIFDELGLQDGDVITGVDGQPMSDPVQAMQMLGTLRNRSSVGLEVLREGKPVKLSYQIH